MRTITTTEYKYNTKTGAFMQERVIPLFEYCELSDAAQARVIADYAEERASDPYYYQNFADTYERDIWECVRDLEKSINGARVSWRYNPWYSCDFDCEFSYDDCYTPCKLETIDDNGYYASMDICDAWNAHVKRLNAICALSEYMAELQFDIYPCHEWECDGKPENTSFYIKLDDMGDNLISIWYEELERACDDVRDTIETLLRGEWDYYTSEEYTRTECEDEYAQGGKTYSCEYPYYKNGGYTGRVYYSDSRKWYTADGEFYEQSTINHACVSIVKAS